MISRRLTRATAEKIAGNDFGLVPESSMERVQVHELAPALGPTKKKKPKTPEKSEEDKEKAKSNRITKLTKDLAPLAKTSQEEAAWWMAHFPSNSALGLRGQIKDTRAVLQDLPPGELRSIALFHLMTGTTEEQARRWFRVYIAKDAGAFQDAVNEHNKDPSSIDKLDPDYVPEAEKDDGKKRKWSIDDFVKWTGAERDMAALYLKMNEHAESTLGAAVQHYLNLFEGSVVDEDVEEGEKETTGGVVDKPVEESEEKSDSGEESDETDDAAQKKKDDEAAAKKAAAQRKRDDAAAKKKKAAAATKAKRDADAAQKKADAEAAAKKQQADDDAAQKQQADDDAAKEKADADKAKQKAPNFKELHLKQQARLSKQGKNIKFSFYRVNKRTGKITNKKDLWHFPEGSFALDTDPDGKPVVLKQLYNNQGDKQPAAMANLKRLEIR